MAIHGYSQADLARRMGRSRSMVHGLIHGHPDPRLSTLELVAKALTTTVSELLREPEPAQSLEPAARSGAA